MGRLKRYIANCFFKYLGNDFYHVMNQNIDRLATSSLVNSGVTLGSESSVHHPLHIHNPQHIKIGNQFYSGPGLRLEAWDSYGGKQYQPKIVIGNRVVLNNNVHIGAIGNIEIGDNVLIGSNVLITDHSHGETNFLQNDIPFVDRPLASKGPVKIDSNVWIGEGVCILSGVTIGSGAIIGANAVVIRDVEPGQIVGGIPARPLTTRSNNVQAMSGK